jgi:hypothetical protein
MPTTDPDRVVVPLDDVECRALLLDGRIGRIAYTRNALPAIQPVSYCVHDGEVVIPALPDSPFAPRAGGAVVAFAVDDYDDVSRTGWNVTVVGPTRSIDDPLAVAVLDALPWPLAGTTHGRRYVAVRIGLLSGWRTEPPVR